MTCVVECSTKQEKCSFYSYDIFQFFSKKKLCKKKSQMKFETNALFKSRFPCFSIQNQQKKCLYNLNFRKRNKKQNQNQKFVVN